MHEMRKRHNSFCFFLDSDTPAARKSETLTFFGHADLKALLQPTVLAAVAGNFVDLTVLVSVARIHHVLLNAAPEKTLKQTQENVLDMDATR